MSRARRLTAALASFLLVGSNEALGETQVVFTVDVESNQFFPLPQQIGAVCMDGSACGLMEIVRMLDERGLAGTFFLNVYEHRSWGEAAMRDIAARLQAAGQDVALHTHPQWAYDPLRPGMHQYSPDEQTSIIEEGVRLLTEWTGRPVVAHRAGDYSADEHTLEALERNGLRLDSSLFWGNPRSRLNGLGLPPNLPSSIGRITEIPVTVYEREKRSRIFGDVFPSVVSVRKIDADWFIDEEEARSAIDAVIEAELPFLVVFLHSFSFLAGSGQGAAPVADSQTKAIFRAILDRVTAKRLPVATMRDLAGYEAAATSHDKHPVPRVTVRVGLHRYVWHLLRAGGTGAVAMGAIVLLFLAGGAWLLVARRRGTAGVVSSGGTPRGRSATRSGVSPR